MCLETDSSERNPSHNAPWKFIAASGERQEALFLAQRIAAVNCPVLIMGPSGVGKDVLAEEIHQHSPRRHKPFVAVNCGALNLHLFESELFGHSRGAYTNALHTKPGLVEIADGGTLFLDEIGDLAPEAQVKLLRFLANGSYWPVGSTNERTADVRVISATNRDLPSMLDITFRSDLYFRLSAVALVVPPLDGADTALLAHSLLVELCHDHGMSLPASQIEEISILAATCIWQGGARELRNVLQRFLLLYEVCSSIDETWRLAIRAPHRQRATRAKLVDDIETTRPEVENPSAVVEQFDDLVFLSLAEETRDVRELAFRLRRSLPTVYERLRRLGIKPRDLGPTAVVISAKEKARSGLAPHQTWIQSIFKVFHKI